MGQNNVERAVAAMLVPCTGGVGSIKEDGPVLTDDKKHVRICQLGGLQQPNKTPTAVPK